MDGNYDAEFNNALSLDQSVIVTALCRQASYDKPDNWVLRNHIELENVKGQLQDCIDKVSHYKSFQLELTHNSRWDQQHLDNQEPIVWHAPMLDAYWDQLEEAIEKNVDGMKKGIAKYCGINIENVEIQNKRLAVLANIILNGRGTNSSTMIMFDNANICEEGIISLSKLVDVSTTLQSFSISHNRIDNMGSAHCLSRSLKSHSSINDLHINHCDLGSSLEILLVILQSDVQFICLCNNNIDSLGAAKIVYTLITTA